MSLYVLRTQSEGAFNRALVMRSITPYNRGGLKIPPSFNAVSGLRYFAHTCVIVYDIMLVRVMEKVHMLFFFI